MLHIHNGDSSAGIAKQTSLPGEHIAWREALVEGPTPPGLSVDDWCSVRANHLAKAYNRNVDDCLTDLRDQQQQLSAFSEREEVVLWFEHDLFCQINLLYLLNWFHSRDLSKTRLSLIFIGEFPGIENFRGLGELTPDQMASLFDRRCDVTDVELALAAEAWAAYCSPDPTAIVDLLGKDTSPLPFLRKAMRLHLSRFPSVRNGLSRVGEIALELIANGDHNFMQIFPRFWQSAPRYGLGDAQVWNEMKRMIDVKTPLLTVTGIEDLRRAGVSELKQAEFGVTEAGAAVLAGKAHFVELNGIDLWLGGAHLSEANLWQWDQDRGRLSSGRA